MAIKMVLLVITIITVSSQKTDSREIDAIIGDTIKLQCRFDPNIIRQTEHQLVYLWHRTNKDGKNLAVVNTNTFSKDYRLETSEGKYDLVISSAQYDRDNGMFDCEIKEDKSGDELVKVTYGVTILIPPGPPKVTTSNTIAKEGEVFQLNCSSVGGSPDPVIQWYRDNVLVEGKVTNGGTRDQPTANVLSIKPSINDDRALYTCTVWNRASREENKMTTSYSLTVHYVPRVKVGPSNPLNVLKNTDARMTCVVEANPAVKKIRWYKNDRFISQDANHTLANVAPSDSGIYSCTADNGVSDANGNPGRAELDLSVQYGPAVSVMAEKEAVVGESISVQCNVNANPAAHTVLWTKEDDADFRLSGEVLTLDRIQPEDTGRYTCTATNSLRPTGSLNNIDQTSNGSTYIRVQHKPGQSEISPANPVAVSGKPYSLACNSKPSGWPRPDYRWWREGNEKTELSRHKTLNFQVMHVSQEGRYYCQPSNFLGKGSIGSVYLTVEEPPSITIPMPPTFVKKADDKSFSMTCRARGKPKPAVNWYHNGDQIAADNPLFRVETRESIEDANVYVLLSVLHFETATRNANAVTAMDRGKYTCVFDNAIGSPAKSDSVLKVEHSPIVRHTYNKVAFDVGENATLQCKMSAYPEPQFEWYFQGRLLDSYSKRYLTSVSDLGDDIFVGSLTIKDAKADDYGDYTCRSWNSVRDDDEKTIIKLVKKSAPDAPSHVEAIEVMSDSVTIRWHEEFNGGFANTEFIINYAAEGDHWRNESCRALNPCRVTGLESQRDYHFRVMAVNAGGQSPYSEVTPVATKVNLKDMPTASEAYYNSEENTLTFRVNPASLSLVGKIEGREGTNDDWTPLTMGPVSGGYETVHLRPSPLGYSDMRIILCLQSNESWCGYEHLVKMDSSATYIKESKSFSVGQFIMVLLAGSSLAVLGVVLLLCCYCYKRRLNLEKKGSEAEDGHNKVSSISPPYYATHDNKLIGSDMVDSSKLSALPIYATAAGSMNGHIAQNYYLTEGNEPSPSGSNDATQSDLWMLKSEMSDGPPDMQMSYHYPSGQVDPNGYQYSYYQQEEYQPLDESHVTLKNALYSPFYDDGHVVYGTTMQPNGVPDQYMDHSPEPYNHHHHQASGSHEDEDDYGSHRTGRVIREIIV
ncbi:Hemicentin-2 [Halotydeus destructor]|nr:Hemicentin-2 [Halotydeus destructor]